MKNLNNKITKKNENINRKTLKPTNTIKPKLYLPPIEDKTIVKTSKNPTVDICSNKLLSKNNRKCKNNIKVSNNTYFNMKVNELLDNLKERRMENKEDNKKIEKTKLKLMNGLDIIGQKQENNKDKIEQSKNIIYNKYDKTSDRNEISSLLELYGNKYNSSDYRNVSFSGLDNILLPKRDIESEEYKLNNFINTGDYKERNIDEPLVKKRKVEIEADIESLKDMIDLCDKYPLDKEIEYNVNMEGIHDIKDDLIMLNSMIGVQSLKQNILDQLLYFIQNLHKIKDNKDKDNKDNKNSDYLHTVIYGSPGTGKTEIAKIIGSIYSKMGLLKKRKFKKATRSDLVAGYLGQTALKTRELVEECLGGVLFIDEAYALGNSEKRDSFAKEAIDTLCEQLSDHKDEIMVIIAGYEKELKDCFFSYNSGLQSRFPWSFKTDDYNGEELASIFKKITYDAGWSIEKDAEKKEWFVKNKDTFKFYGRDMENLFTKTKISHSRRVFGKKKEERAKITLDDLNKGLELFLSHNEDAKTNASSNSNIIETMYN